MLDLDLHLYHVFVKLTKKRWMKREREIRKNKDCNGQRRVC